MSQIFLSLLYCFPTFYGNLGNLGLKIGNARAFLKCDRKKSTTKSDHNTGLHSLSSSNQGISDQSYMVVCQLWLSQAVRTKCLLTCWCGCNELAIIWNRKSCSLFNCLFLRTQNLFWYLTVRRLKYSSEKIMETAKTIICFSDFHATSNFSFFLKIINFFLLQFLIELIKLYKTPDFPERLRSCGKEEGKIWRKVWPKWHLN